MSGIPSFDTAEYEDRLTSGGVDSKSARAHRVALTGALDDMREPLATRSDLQALEAALTWKLLGGVGAIVGLFTALNALISAIAAGLFRLH